MTSNLCKQLVDLLLAGSGLFQGFFEHLLFHLEGPLKERDM